MAALLVKDAYGINEAMLKQLAASDPTYDTANQIWQRAKMLRFDSLTQEQMDTLEAIEMDLLEHETNQVYSLF